MLRDILEDAIRAHPDLELVTPDDAVDLPTAIERQRPDAVIVTQEGPGLNLARVELASVVRPLGVLIVAGGGRQARLMQLRQVPVSDVSPRGVMETIRAACASRNE